MMGVLMPDEKALILHKVCRVTTNVDRDYTAQRDKKAYQTFKQMFQQKKASLKVVIQES